MKNNKALFAIKSFFVLVIIGIIVSSCSQEPKLLTSPDSSIVVTCGINEKQKAFYKITKDNKIVILPSQLGIKMEDNNFATNLHLNDLSKISLITDTYEMIQGKKRIRNYKANQQTFTFRNVKGEYMEVIFRVSNDGVAFQYHFPGQSDDIKVINEEMTSYVFPFEAKAWMQPMSAAKTGWCRTNPSYEEKYFQHISVGSVSPLKAGWVFPALIKSGDNWILLTETGVDRNYCGSRLYAQPNARYKIGFPDPAEKYPNGNVNPESTLPWTTPWRVIAIGSLKTITESTLETDLANPKVDGDFSWVKPGKSSWSWVLLKDDSTVYTVQKKYIDYAADMKWDYCLVDADWDRKIGLEKIKELSDYAHSKGVGLNLWYNSAGSWNDTPYTPKSKLLTPEQRKKEFSILHDIGIKGIKVDFFGGDGQSMIQYYIDLIEDAAKHQLMINFHGCTYPRSWHRTYPNLVTMEAIKGMEFATFEQANANQVPTHAIMATFTRNLFSPMDFTPMALYKLIPTQRVTTNAYELATSVMFLSGIQHYAERPEGIATVPQEVKEVLQSLPAVYDESVFVDGYPGKLNITARRDGDIWYVAALNGENTDKELELDLSFIKSKSGLIINEGEDQFQFALNKIQLNGKDKLPIKIKANGGFLMVFK